MMSRDSDDKMQKVLDVLNGAWELLPYENRPTYEEFNSKVSFELCLDALLDYEKNNPALGLCGFNPDNPSVRGLSVLSILATITDIFTDGRYRFAVVIDTDDPRKTIGGFGVQEFKK
jgi:hypothetical protein